MNKPPKNILLLGVGNYLMGDEGVGVHIAQRWQQETLQRPDSGHIDVLDGGTGGFHLLEYFERYDTVILVDATLNDRQPGTFRLIRPRFASDFPAALSTHDIGLKDMIGALQLLGKMPDIYLFAVSIDSIQQQGIELTPAVAAAIPFLMNEIRSLADASLAGSPVRTLTQPPPLLIPSGSFPETCFQTITRRDSEVLP